MPDLPGFASPHLGVSVRRALGRAGDAARRSCRAPRARAGGSSSLGGEPGSGKSRLVREFAARGGAATARSSSTARATPSCARRTGPFVEALERLARPSTRPSCGPRSAPAAASSPACSPISPSGSASLPPPVRADPDTERHRLHTAVTDLLDRCHARAPALLVLEDGHWADALDAAAPPPPGARRRRRARAPARHLPRHRGGRAGGARPRRSPTSAGPTTSSGCGSRGLSGDEVAEFVGAAPPEGDLGRRAARARRARSATSRAGNPFLVCELWRALVETGAVELVDGAMPADAAARRDRQPGERARGRQPAALAPRAGDHAICSSSRPRPAVGVRARRSSARAGLAGARAPRRTRRGRPQRDARGAARAAGSPTASPTSSCAGPLYDRLSAACGAPSSICASARRWKAAAGRSGRALADLAHHFAAAAPFGGAERGVEYNVLAARAAAAALAFDEAATRPADRARARDRRPARAGRASSSSSATRATAAARRSTRWRRSGRRPTSRASSATRELLARAAIGYEDACWRPGMADQGAVEPARGGCARRSATTTRSCGSGCSAGSRARSTSRATTSAARSSARARSRWRGSSTTASGSPPC